MPQYVPNRGYQPSAWTPRWMPGWTPTPPPYRPTVPKVVPQRQQQNQPEYVEGVSRDWRDGAAELWQSMLRKAATPPTGFVVPQTESSRVLPPKPAPAIGVGQKAQGFQQRVQSGGMQVESTTDSTTSPFAQAVQQRTAPTASAMDLSGMMEGDYRGLASRIAKTPYYQRPRMPGGVPYGLPPADPFAPPPYVPPMSQEEFDRTPTGMDIKDRMGMARGNTDAMNERANSANRWANPSGYVGPQNANEWQDTQGVTSFRDAMRGQITATPSGGIRTTPNMTVPQSYIDLVRESRNPPAPMGPGEKLAYDARMAGSLIGEESETKSLRDALLASGRTSNFSMGTTPPAGMRDVSGRSLYASKQERRDAVTANAKKRADMRTARIEARKMARTNPGLTRMAFAEALGVDPRWMLNPQAAAFADAAASRGNAADRNAMDKQTNERVALIYQSLVAGEAQAGTLTQEKANEAWGQANAMARSAGSTLGTAAGVGTRELPGLQGIEVELLKFKRDNPSATKDDAKQWYAQRYPGHDPTHLGPLVDKHWPVTDPATGRYVTPDELWRIRSALLAGERGRQNRPAVPPQNFSPPGF